MSPVRAIRRAAERVASPQTVNFWCHVFEGGFAMLGMQLASGGTAMPGGRLFALLASDLHVEPSTFGFLTSLAGLAPLLALLLAPRIEAVRRKKRLILVQGLGQRLPLLLSLLGLALFAQDRPVLCLGLVAVANLLMATASHLNGPPWFDLLADTIPRRLLGRMFGYRHSISAALGLLAAALCTAVLAADARPTNFLLLYGIAFVALMLSYAVLTLVDDVPDDLLPKARRPAGEYFRDLLGSLKRDRNFRHFVEHAALSRLGLLAAPFCVLTARQTFGLGREWVAVAFIGGISAGQLVASVTASVLSERLGPKRILLASTVLWAAAMVLAAAAPAGWWYAGVFLLLGLGWGARGAGTGPFIARVFPRERRVGSFSLTMLVMAPVMLLGPAAAGLVLEQAGHVVLFALFAVGVAAALAPLLRCRPSETDEEDAPASQE